MRLSKIQKAKRVYLFLWPQFAKSRRSTTNDSPANSMATIHFQSKNFFVYVGGSYFIARLIKKMMGFHYIFRVPPYSARVARHPRRLLETARITNQTINQKENRNESDLWVLQANPTSLKTCLKKVMPSNMEQDFMFYIKQKYYV